MNRETNSTSDVSSERNDSGGVLDGLVRLVLTAVVWTVVAVASVAVAVAGVTVGLALGIEGLLGLLALWGLIIAASGMVSSLVRRRRATL